MNIVIFFGGILFGFLIGFTSMALMAAANYRAQCEELHEAFISRQILPHLDDAGSRYRHPDKNCWDQCSLYRVSDKRLSG